MMRSLTSTLVATILIYSVAPRAGAGTVIADFNDLNLGQLNEAAGQAADTGTGFTEAFWPHDSSMVLALDGDLTPPAGSNYVPGQTGIGRSLGNAFGAPRARQNQTRNCELLAEGTVWLSALFSLNGTDAEGTITFNGNRQIGGGSSNAAAAISFGDNGTPGAVGTLLPSEDALANVTDITQRADSAVATDGAAHLLIAKLELRDGDDTITLWLDPTDVTDETSLGAPLLTHTAAYFDTNFIDKVGYEAVREDDPDSDTNGGLALLDNLRLSDASNALAVVASNAAPVIPSALLQVTGTPTFPDLVDAPTGATSTIAVTNAGTGAPVEVTGVSFGGDDAAKFSSTTTFPLTVAANGGSADIDIVFESGGESGIFAATATILSDAPNTVPLVDLSASYVANGAQVLSNGDFEASGGSLDAWDIFAENVATTTGFAPGSTTAAQITASDTYLQQNTTVTSDWYAEFYFQIQDTTARAFNVNITATGSQINIRYQGDSGQWNAYDSADVGDGWGGLDGSGTPLGLGSITPGAAYFMRVVGHGWGTATPTYDLYLSEAGSSNLSRSAPGIARYQNGVPTDGPPRAIRFTSQYGGNPGFSVDDVHVASGPGPSDAPPFAITNFTYDLSSDEFTITWNSDPSRVYGVFFSTDAVDWGGDVNDSINADLGATETTFGPFPNPLTTDLGTPQESRPPTILFRVQDQGTKP